MAIKTGICKVCGSRIVDGFSPCMEEGDKGYKCLGCDWQAVQIVVPQQDDPEKVVYALWEYLPNGEENYHCRIGGPWGEIRS